MYLNMIALIFVIFIIWLLLLKRKERIVEVLAADFMNAMVKDRWFTFQVLAEKVSNRHLLKCTIDYLVKNKKLSIRMKHDYALMTEAYAEDLGFDPGYSFKNMTHYEFMVTD